MLHTLEMERPQSLAVEIFGAFLAEHYGYDDLMFFLQARQLSLTVLQGARRAVSSPEKVASRPCLH